MIKIKKADILLVEDNPGDARLAKEAIAESGTSNNLWWVKDGEEAMAFLYREGEYKDAPKPDLILLDLNMPKMDGSEVLAALKGNHDLRCIPIVVLTVSKADEDVRDAYDAHANCYIVKPIDIAGFIDVITGIQEFWFKVVRLPPGEE